LNPGAGPEGRDDPAPPAGPPAFAGLTGRTLGQYRILELVGEGGMGEVYRAEDLKLRRTVAVKVLPPSFVASPERVQRFEREARAASAINHPSIATIYDFGTADGVHFIVMEYVDGQSLSAWLSRDDLTLAEVLRVLELVGDALARAHEAGVVHRDVKPANVIVARDGYPKLLDFGLAKVTGESGPYTEADIRDRLSTRSGVVMGTMAYMSPEQARGQKLDRRSDIFSFGILTYEAVAGVPPFAGDSGVEAVSKVLRDDPIPLLRERPGIPRDLVRIIGKALQKEPAQRYQFMDDLVVDLRAVRRALESGETEAAESGAGVLRRWLLLAAGLVTGLVSGALLLGGLTAPPPPPSSPLLRAGMVQRPLTFGAGLSRSPSVSPDGALVSYACDRHGSFDITVQQVTTGRPLRVTDDPGDELDPAFSPDGQLVAYTSGGGGVQTVAALGGTPRSLAEDGEWPAWSPDGQWVVYRSGLGLAVVARNGGSSRRVFDDDAFPVLDRPAWTPDGRSVLFTSEHEGRRVVARIPAAGGAPGVVGDAARALGWPSVGADGRFLFGTSPPGERGSEIWALPVGAEGRLGEPRRVLGGVLDFRRPSVSRDQRRMAFEVRDALPRLVRIPLDSGSGEPVRVPLEARPHDAAVAPSGSWLAVVTDRGGRRGLLRVGSVGGVGEPVGDDEGSDAQPAWSPDGFQIAASRVTDGQRRIVVTPAAGGPWRVVAARNVEGDPAWSPDGRAIAYVGTGPAAVRVIPAAGGEERTLATGPRVLRRPAWSPDGRFIAVAAGDRRSWGVSLLPAGGGPLREVVPRARAPLWLPDGRLAFVREDSPGRFDLWAVPMANGQPDLGRLARLTRLPRGLELDPDRGATTDGRSLYVAVLELAASDVWLGEAP
jgi:Tol biopolymer transport system component/predicted Ser/Thr protein kinase